MRSKHRDRSSKPARPQRQTARPCGLPRIGKKVLEEVEGRAVDQELRVLAAAVMAAAIELTSVAMMQKSFWLKKRLRLCQAPIDRWSI